MSDKAPMDKRTKANLIVAGACVASFAGMVGLSYAAVPLYAAFCQVTGYEGTTQRVTQYSDRVLNRTIRIRFDANTNGVPWTFEPVKREMVIRIGETAEAHYTAKNLFGETNTGKATFNVTPELAGSYFNKVECFCFTETTLKPGEQLDMPVVFYVDPSIVDEPDLKGVQTITLSYTFFPTKPTKPVAAAQQTGQNELKAAAQLGG